MAHSLHASLSRRLALLRRDPICARVLLLDGVVNEVAETLAARERAVRLALFCADLCGSARAGVPVVCFALLGALFLASAWRWLIAVHCLQALETHRTLQIRRLLLATRPKIRAFRKFVIRSDVSNKVIRSALRALSPACAPARPVSGDVAVCHAVLC